jgi:hypothetical protein
MDEIKNVSNEVLLVKLQSMSEVVLANNVMNHEAHQAILTQTTRTNGRVSDLEKVKNMLVGGLLITNVLLIPILLFFLTEYFSKK